MQKQHFKQLVLAVSLTTLSFVANATPLPADLPSPAVDNFHNIYAKDFSTGVSTYKTTFLGDKDATFTAKVTNGGNVVNGLFSKKNDQSTYSYDGVGVSPKTGSERTAGEIDIGEYIDAKFTTAGTTEAAGIYIKSFTLGLLFDGPEYSDVNEVAQITATLFNGGSLTYTFTATGLQSGVWTGPTGSFANLSPAADGRGGLWQINNPFGNVLISGLSFTALNGVKGSAGGAGTNQSDFTLVSISAVPEPETYAMMLAGLAGIGVVARKKKQA